MQRAHMLPNAKDVVFVDTTSSCDAANSAITFLLTPCAAGAVPLGIIITNGQTTMDYEAGFRLLQKTVNKPFKNSSSPANFVTDDSDAEREALKLVWPNSRFLCHFHISQSMWRWLLAKENGIPQNERQSLYRSFKAVLMSATEEEAIKKFDAAVQHDIASKFPNWVAYLKVYWQRRDTWALAWRDASLHDNHTNNYCEASVRLFKDMVMGRNKANNVVSLIDFASVVLEDYYVQCLRKFTHSRCEAPRLTLNHKLAKAAYVQKNDIVESDDKSVYKVPSETTQNLFYEVNVNFGTCTCYVGSRGTFCKHQAAVFLHFQKSSPSTPAVSMESRFEMAVLALGENAKPQSFYRPLRCSKQNISNMDHEPSASIADISEDRMLTDTAQMCKENNKSLEAFKDSATDEDFNEYLEVLRRSHEKFGTSKLILSRIMKRLDRVSTRNGWDTYQSTAGAYISHHTSHAKIEVQPTSISRRRDGVTRGSKRLPAGRPPVGETQRRGKRKRNLAENVAKNQANAKSH